MSDAKVLALLKKDFGFLGKMCGVEFDKLKGAADRLYSFMYNLETELVASAGTVEGSSPPSGAKDRVCKSLTESYQAMGHSEGIVGLESLMKTKNAYVLTSLMLGVSAGGLEAQTKQDQEVYSNLKKFLNNVSKDMSMVLGDVSRARVALLSWNMMATLHKNSVMVKIHEDIVKRKKATYKAMESVLPQLIDNSFSKEQSGGLAVKLLNIEQLILDQRERLAGKKKRKVSRKRASSRRKRSKGRRRSSPRSRRRRSR